MTVFSVFLFESLDVQGHILLLVRIIRFIRVIRVRKKSLYNSASLCEDKNLFCGFCGLCVP